MVGELASQLFLFFLFLLLDFHDCLCQGVGLFQGVKLAVGFGILYGFDCYFVDHWLSNESVVVG